MEVMDDLGFSDGKIYCELCEISCSGRFMYDQHVNGTKHQKKAKRKELENLWNARDPSVYCSVCQLGLEPSLMSKHLAGVKHRAMVQKRPAAEMARTEEHPTPGSGFTMNHGTASKKTSFSEEIKCDICSVTLTSLVVANTHFSSKTHVTKCARKYVDDRKAVERNSENSFYCDVCDRTLTGQESYESHLQGFKHNYKLTKGNFDADSPFAAKSVRMKEKLQKMKEAQKAKRLQMKLKKKSEIKVIALD